MQRFKKSAPNEQRVVLDTNVLISASIISHGAPARILAAAVDKKIKLIVSDRLLDEYLVVIRRLHIRRKYQKVSERIQEVTLFLHRSTLRVQVFQVERVVPDDAKDDFLLASAVEGQAHYLVSGDEHLLALAEYRNIKILKPRDFCQQVLGEKVPSKN